MQYPRIPIRQKYARAAARTAASGIARQAGLSVLHDLLSAVSDIALCSADLLTNPLAIGEAFVVFAGAGSGEGCGGGPVVLRDVVEAYEATLSVADRDARALALLAHLGRVAASVFDAAPLPEEHRPGLAALAGLVLTETDIAALQDPTCTQPIIAIVGDGAASRSCGRIYRSITSVPASWMGGRTSEPLPTGTARH